MKTLKYVVKIRERFKEYEYGKDREDYIVWETIKKVSF